MSVSRIVLFLATVAALFLTQSCNWKQWQSKRELQLGVADYKSSRYEDAIKHFQRAVELDPNSVEARRYLDAMSAPSGSDGGSQYAEAAIRLYQEVLKQNPSQLEAVEGLAYLHFQLAHYETAKQFYLRASRLEPTNAEHYYSAAMIDWTESYQSRMTKRAELNMPPSAPLINKKVCLELRAANWDRVNDGIQMLNKALELRPDYKDAMAYMNLLYRERADLQCGNRAAYGEDLKNAEFWVDRTLAAMKAATENK